MKKFYVKKFCIISVVILTLIPYSIVVGLYRFFLAFKEVFQGTMRDIKNYDIIFNKPCSKKSFKEQ